MASSDPTGTGGQGFRHKAVHGIRGAVGGLHGTGEAVRGTFNQTVDTIMGDEAGVKKNQAIADGGLAEISDGKQRKLAQRNAAPGGTTATTTEKAGHYSTPSSGTGSTAVNSSTNYGPHDSNIANKADPRVDSDLDHRGTSTNTSTSTGLGATGATHGQTHDNPSSANYGPHSSSIANKADPRVDSDLDGRGTHGATGTTHTTTSGSTNAGPHNSNLANKLDPRVDSDRDGRGSYGTGNTATGHSTSNTGYDNPRSTNDGPHGSNVANKLDPRVDSDRDGRGTHTAGTHGTGTTHTATGHSTSTTGYDHPRSTNAGPHDSNAANKLDPRVDSDRDGRGTHTGGTSHATGYSGTGTGHENPRSTNAGPHDSNLANKLDPRVDSDRDGRGTHSSSTGYGTSHATGTGHNSSTGYDNPRSTNDGPHDSNIANKLDPRVDSDRDNRGTHTGGSGYGTGHGTGTSTSTTGHDNTRSTNAGPHDSNIANKLDPRVDSDRDNRGTTHHTSGGRPLENDPFVSKDTCNHPSSSNYGPHSSNIMNKLDPRVDSDRDGSKTTGETPRTNATATSTGGQHTGTSGTTGTSGYDNSRSTNAGPHDSNFANKADPRVDSDLDGRGQHHGTSTTGGSTGYGGSSGYDNPHSSNAGPHSSNIANKADPRVDSDLDGRGTGTSTGAHNPGQYRSGPGSGNYGNRMDYNSSTGTEGGYSHQQPQTSGTTGPPVPPKDY